MALKKCISCKEDILKEAKVCKHCGTAQNLRRFLNIGNAFMSLLVALVAVLSFAIPQYMESRISDSSDVTAEFTFANDSSIFLLLSNNGRRPALLKGISIEIDEFELSLEMENITSDQNLNLIPARSTSILALNGNKLIKNGLYAEFETGELEESYSEIVYHWLEMTEEDEDSTFDLSWAFLGLNFLQSRYDQLDFETLDNLYLDWEVENNYERIQHFIIPEGEEDRYFGEEWMGMSEEDLEATGEALGEYESILKALQLLEEYFGDKITIKVNVYNSGGTPQEFALQVPYDAIRRFVFSFYFSKDGVDWESASYFYDG